MSRYPSHDHVDTVIIGAGIVGCSTALALAQAGFTDVLLIDRSRIETPAGSTGHAPGLLGQISASLDLTELAKRSTALYRGLRGVGTVHTAVGSIEVSRSAKAKARFENKIRLGEAAGIEARLVDNDELCSLLPAIEARDIAAAVFVPEDGVLEARRALSAIATGVRQAGIEIRESTEVHAIVVERGKVVGVETADGRVTCSRVLLAVGIWGTSFLSALDVRFPLFPVQHPYIYTEPLPWLSPNGSEATLPFVRDIDRLTYYRQHGNRFGYGWYNHPPALANMLHKRDSVLPYRNELFKPSESANLFPFLKEAPVQSRLNGVFSMTPDGLPLLGALRGFEGLWVAEAVWVTHAGGLGQAIAELLLQGTTNIIDAGSFDPNRFANDSLESACARSLSLYNDIYQWPMP